MFSIVIPAYNEEKVLTKVLSYLFADDVLSNAEIIVVLNGCKDNTASNLANYLAEQQDTLERKKLPFQVFDIEKASKTNAINVGLANVSNDYVVLLDADIFISGKHISQLVEALENSNLYAMSPKVNFDTSNASGLLKKYYDIEKASYYNNHLRLSNVIALSRKAMNSLGALPEVIADDEYIRRSLPQNSYRVFNDATHTFKTPKSLTSQLSVLTRVERGNFQLATLDSQKIEHPLLDSGKKVPISSLLLFYCVKIYAKLVAKLQFRMKQNYWQRDESSRI